VSFNEHRSSAGSAPIPGLDIALHFRSVYYRFKKRAMMHLRSDKSDCAAFILAGGKSSRMGTDKAFVMLNGRTLLRHALDLVSAVTANVSIVGAPSKFQEFAPVVEDIFPGCGPIAGIHAALQSSASDLNLILAVDVPLVPADLLRYLLAQAQSHSDAIAIVPRTGLGWQPLCAVYRREFSPAAEAALRAGNYKIDALFSKIKVLAVEEGELAVRGFSPGAFRNLNTQDEVIAASGSPMATTNSMDETPQLSTLQSAAEAAPLVPYIEFRDVSKAFGDNVVLNHVNFQVMPGETVCILGRSGVGKSVSLHEIMGFLKPDAGRVIVAGEDITEYTEEQMEPVRKKVTMVFQNGALFDSLTVGENVAFPLRESGDLSEEQMFQIIDGLLQMVGVQEMRDLLPSDLSTGMKRSVAIARALAARPECILYDEPTTMVDPLMAQLLGDLIKRLKIQLHLTSIVVTHDMRLAEKVADKIVFLYEGKAIFFGTYAQMEKDPHPIVQEFLQLDELKLEA